MDAFIYFNVTMLTTCLISIARDGLHNKAALNVFLRFSITHVIAALTYVVFFV